nr:MAG TPA: hypothetical protein [Bacteriophage sp.]
MDRDTWWLGRQVPRNKVSKSLTKSSTYQPSTWQPSTTYQRTLKTQEYPHGNLYTRIR